VGTGGRDHVSDEQRAWGDLQCRPGEGAVHVSCVEGLFGGKGAAFHRGADMLWFLRMNMVLFELEKCVID
jgi:hypothetical protein